MILKYKKKIFSKNEYSLAPQTDYEEQLIIRASKGETGFTLTFNFNIPNGKTSMNVGIKETVPVKVDRSKS